MFFVLVKNFQCALRRSTGYLETLRYTMPKIEVAATQITAALGTYCWERGCVDKIDSASTLLKGIAPTDVEPGATITVKFTTRLGPMKITMSRWLAENNYKNVMFKNNQLIAPTKAGTYFYIIWTTWQEGDAAYSFAIRVK